MYKFTALILLSSILLGGCQTRYVTGINAEQKQQATKIPILEEKQPVGSYLLLERQLKGESCRVTADDDTVISKEDALRELQYAASKVGADLLANVSCIKKSHAVGSCLAAFICTGDGYAKK
jgi:hypothetical protein